MPIKSRYKKKVRSSYGCGGWIEGYTESEEKFTKLTSKSTGLSITMPGWEDHYSGNDIRQAILVRYSKDYKRIFCSMCISALEEDFN